MTALSRRSPKLVDAHTKEDVRRAIDTLEDRPRSPRKTPSGPSDDGYEGEICHDDDYAYLYAGGAWTRRALSW